MTIGEIITEAREELGEVPGTQPYGDPLPWPNHVARAMDEIARKTRCYYATFRVDVQAGAAQVSGGACPACPLFEIEEARLTLIDGATVVQLGLITPDALQGYCGAGYPYGGDRSGSSSFGGSWWDGGDWRSDVPVPRPLALVTAGANNLRLFPAPNYSLAQALALTGFAVPVRPGSASGDPAGGWGDADECPLPTRAHDAVKSAAVLRRCRQYPRLYADRIALWQAQSQSDLALLTAESRGLTRAGRVVGAYA